MQPSAGSANFTSFTHSFYRSEDKRKWILIDAKDAVLGRLASRVAERLRGKHRPDYTPHADSGDHVIIVNAQEIGLTGNKRSTKTYHRHTGHPGGLKSQTAKTILGGRFPDRVVESAILRMMPDGPLAERQYGRLRVYAGPTHPHEAQRPQPLDIGALNPKNILHSERRDTMAKNPSHMVEQIRDHLKDDFEALRAEIAKLADSGQDTNKKLSEVVDDIREGKKDFHAFREEQRTATADTNATLRKILEQLTPR